MSKQIYRVGDKTFSLFSEAIKYAQPIRAEVFEIENGKRRWSPAPPVSTKKMAQYHNQMDAYKAQQALNSK